MIRANASFIDYTVTFSESVTGVDTNDFTLTKTGTANGTVASVTGSGSSYTVRVNGITGTGTLRLDLNGTGTGIQDTATTPNAITTGFTTGGTHSADLTAPTFDVAPRHPASPRPASPCPPASTRPVRFITSWSPTARALQPPRKWRRARLRAGGRR